MFIFWFYRQKQKSLKKYTELWDGIKNKIKAINSGKEGKYGEKFMKFKFDTDDKWSLNKLLKLHMLTIIVRSAYEESGKVYLQL